MLLFHSAGQGRIIPVNASSSDILSTYATLGDDGKVRVVLINKDAKQNVTARIAMGQPYKSATTMRLTGESLDSADYISFAGSQVDEDGTWSPRVIETIGLSNGRFELAVPPASAVVVTFG
jgi:alpha-L-arabinofuranosidase